MNEMGIDNKAEILYIKLKMKEGQAFINFLKDKFKNTQFINQRFKILYENEYVLFPIFNNQVLINKVTNLVIIWISCGKGIIIGCASSASCGTNNSWFGRWIV